MNNIGLEGSWCSGKSTVIEILGNKLGKNNEEKNLLIKFDAWEHEGDRLRRVFLWSFIDELKPKINYNKELDNLREEISKPKKDRKIKSKSKV